MAKRKISPERKGVYYGGLFLVVLGFLTFCSVFITAISHFGDFTNFDANVKSSMTRAVLGMAMVIVGGILTSIGARGVAGSGIVLDPQRAREDIEPWSRMAGGVLKDALDESGIDSQEIGFEEKLRKLHALYQDGILTEEEYQNEKAELLDRN